MRYTKRLSLIKRLTLFAILCGFVLSATVKAQNQSVETTAETAAENKTEVVGEKTDEARSEETKTTQTDEKQSAADLTSTQLIADATPKEAVWLETSQGKWLGFFKETESKENKGVLLMIHASEQPQRWPAVLELLRRHLPLNGWETFAFAIPTERLGENTTAETLAAAINYLQQKGKFNLVLLSDNRLLHPATQHLLPQIKTNPKDPKTIDGPTQALIIVNIQSQYPLTQETLESVFSSPEMPVMDAFFNPPSTTQVKDMRLHKTTAARKKLITYRQQTFSIPEENALDEPQQFWISSVRGFLDKEAKGTELK
jgi:Protein of unknown function (DUF3530)